jgi:cytochrome P450
MSRTPESTTTAAADPAAEQIFYGIMMGDGSALYESYDQLRSTAPALLTSDGSLVLSRHADCDAALRNPALGKGDEFMRMKVSAVPEETLRTLMERLQRSMIMVNPPEHTRLRRLVSKAFTAGHVEGLRPAVAQRTRTLLAGLAAEQGADFMTDFALIQPSHVISDLLGVPESDRPALTPHILNLGLLVEPTATPEQVATGITAEAELAGYLADLLRHKRAQPADDMLSRLAAEQENDALDETEMLATALLLFLGGNKTTADLLGNSVHTLLTHPDQLRRLRDDPGLAGSAVEEMLRWDSPMQLNARTALEGATVAGTKVEPGQTIIILLGAANHDPERFTDPGTVDIGRPDNRHLAFSAGIHFCLGGPLARLEAAVFLEQLVTDYSGVAFAGDPVRHPGIGMRSFDSLPVTLTK